MISRIKNWIREFIVGLVIENIVVGGHCGICGKWVDKAVVPPYWRWTICKECSDPEKSVNENGLHSSKIEYPKKYNVIKS